jgi:hypothetical protein
VTSRSKRYAAWASSFGSSILAMVQSFTSAHLLAARWIDATEYGGLSRVRR